MADDHQDPGKVRQGDGTPGPKFVCACGNRLRARSEQVSGRCWGCGIADERRQDDDFVTRLCQRIEEDRPILDALAASDGEQP